MKKIVMSLLIVMVMLVQLQFPLYAAVRVEESLDMEKIQAMEAEIQRNIELGYPSMNILVVKGDEVIYQNAFGYKNRYNGFELLTNPESVTVDTMYDLASNSKMYATNFALQKLIYEGKLSLDDKVSSILPEFVDQEGDAIKGKSDLTVLQILQHTAGFPADPQYHNESYANDLYSQDKELTLQKIYETPLEYEPGTKNIYSDVDYMILGYIIEEITQMPFDVYVETQIYQPLGLENTMFNPLEKGFEKNDFAATERVGNSRDGNISFNNIRNYTIQGEVHDEKAYHSMEGVSGHAGLFSNTQDMSMLLQVMLNGGTVNGVTLFDQEIIDQFTAPSPTNSSYGLGWRINTDYKMASTFGQLASDKTYGHTGWTGTVTAIDPEKDIAVVVLGNRPNSPVYELSNLNVFASGKLPISSYGYVLDMIWDATTIKETESGGEESVPDNVDNTPDNVDNPQGGVNNTSNDVDNEPTVSNNQSSSPVTQPSGPIAAVESNTPQPSKAVQVNNSTNQPADNSQQTNTISEAPATTSQDVKLSKTATPSLVTTDNNSSDSNVAIYLLMIGGVLCVSFFVYKFR